MGGCAVQVWKYLEANEAKQNAAASAYFVGLEQPDPHAAKTEHKSITGALREAIQFYSTLQVSPSTSLSRPQAVAQHLQGCIASP